MIGKVKTITLVLTQTCNLSCSYCYEGNKNGKKMSFSVAKDIIDKELSDDRFEKYIVDFFGGEPLLEFDLIKQCVQYLRDNYAHKNIVLAMTTNGVLVKGAVKDWLYENKDDLEITLSLDGTPKMHNINRCNSFSLIDVEFFHKCWPKQLMKMTISAETLPDLAEGIIYMHEHDYAFSCNLAFGIDWSNPTLEGILERELKKLIDYYLEHKDVEPCMLFQYNFDRVPMKIEKDTSLRACGAGVEMVTYSCEGRPYPCQFFTPVSLGEEAAKEAEKIVFKDVVTIDDFPEPCHSCPVITICHTCYGADYAQCRDIYKKDANLCKLNKILFKAAAFLWLEKYKRKDLHCAPEVIPQMMKGVQIILDKLQ